SLHAGSDRHLRASDPGARRADRRGAHTDQTAARAATAPDRRHGRYRARAGRPRPAARLQAREGRRPMSLKNDDAASGKLRAENDELRKRLAEAEDALRAIREGDVDAIIVSGTKGDRVFSLAESENLHRIMVETMNEAGIAASTDGTILYCN